MAAATTDQNNLHELITAHQKRLGLLQIKAATFGDDVPVHILGEIDDLDKTLAQLKAAAAQPISPALVEELGPTGRYQLWMANIMRLDADIGQVRREVERLHERFDDLLTALAAKGIKARPRKMVRRSEAA